MNKILVLSFLLLTTQAVLSQAPGFMGRRSSVTFDLNPTSALLIPNSNFESVKKLGYGFESSSTANIFAMTYRPEINIDYLITKNISVGINASKFEYGSTFTVDGWEHYDQYANKYEVIHIRSIIKGHSFGLNVKLYGSVNKGLVAPLGSYINIDLKTSILNSYLASNQNQNLFKNNFIIPAVSFGIGKNTVFLNNFIIQYGVDICLPFVGVKYWEYDWQYNAEEASPYFVYDSVLRSSLLNINFGIGLLTF